MMKQQITEQFSRYAMGSTKTPGKLERLHVALIEKELEIPCHYETYTGVQKVTIYGLRLKGYAEGGDFHTPLYTYEFDHLHVDKDQVLRLLGSITCNHLTAMIHVFLMINAFRSKHSLKVYSFAHSLFTDKIVGFRGNEARDARERGEVFMHFNAGNSVYAQGGRDK